MSTGRIVKSGGKELALELEANGYADYRIAGGLRACMADVTPIRTRGGNRAARAVPRRARRACPGAAPPRARARPSRPSPKAGLPHRRVEAWKYTDLRTLLRDAAPLATAPDRSRA